LVTLHRRNGAAAFSAGERLFLDAVIPDLATGTRRGLLLGGVASDAGRGCRGSSCCMKT
jgi:hypothetical protein